MKKLMFIGFIFILYGIAAFGQTNAADYTLTDCSGNSHSLYTELDSGKVIVISFVMPCGACVSPTLSAFNSVAAYADSNPGRVKFYISDDSGTDSCSSINTWASQNGLQEAEIISDTALKMSQYSLNGLGMPKIVVLGGTSHLVYYNENSGADLHQIGPAIDQALGTSGLPESENNLVNLKVFPNPVNNTASLVYSITETNNIGFEVINILGETLKTITIQNQPAGNKNVQIDFEGFKNGLYFLKLNAMYSSQIVKFTIAN